jgi:hypothetical protein
MWSLERSPIPLTETATSDPDFGVTVMLGWVLSPPRRDTCVDAEDERRAEHDDAEGEHAALRARSLGQSVGRDCPQEDGGCRRPEGAEARERMVPGHSSDQVAADRKCGQQGPQCWQGGEKEACGALGFLPDWEEPRHDGTGTVAPSPG